MQNLVAEQAFYADLFGRKPDNEHITGGYEELHALALPAVPTGPVVDVGCGTGAHAVRLAQRGCDVIALDLTREGVRAARARFQSARLRGRFLVADAEHLPFRDHAASVAWTFLLLHHFPRLDRLPAELARVTRERIVAYEPNAHNLLTWFANNVVNRWWGLASMTPNQRALRPRRLGRVFGAQGFPRRTVRYVDRQWSDGFGLVRRAYQVATRWLPQRVRANKFLIILER